MSTNPNLSNFHPCTPFHESRLHIVSVNPSDEDFTDITYIEEDFIDCKLYPNPIEGYQKHKDLKTGFELPLCCQFHQNIFEEAREWFSVFPYCCENHKKIAKEKWFNKENYNFLPEKIVLQLSQTEHVISEKIDNPDWYEAITGYIDHNFLCFGVYAIGLNIYLSSLEQYIISPRTAIHPDKSKKLVDYIKYVGQYYKYSIKWDYTPSELKKWLDIFPFDLEYYENLREIYTSNITSLIPFDTNTGRHIYAAVPYNFNDEILKVSLNKLTGKILNQINCLTLYKEGKLNDPKKHKFNLLMSRRKLELQQLIQESSGSPENIYIKTLKKWLKGEMKFLKAIIKERKINSDLQVTPGSGTITSLSNDTIEPPNDTTTSTPLKLDDFFADASKYNHIMELLVDKEFCYPETHIWKDFGKNHKTLIISLLRLLHLKKYYKNNVLPSNEALKEIAKNTFGIEISIDTVKKTKPEDFTPDFIPIAEE